MRVAIHHTNSEHPNSKPFAYRVGRIEAQTDIITGESTPADKVAEKLLDAAKREYPDHEVRLEHYNDNGDGTGSWVEREVV